MKAKVFGAGLQGRAIAWALKQLGFDVVRVYDPNYKELGKLFIETGLTNEGIQFTMHPWVKGYDIVVSAAPYDCNLEIAKSCTDAGVKYCDLGGNPDVSRAIQEQAKAPVFTDLGLAPGWISIIAEEMMGGKKEGSNVKLMVGGLPRARRSDSKLDYAITFSPKGVYNEYTGMCDSIKNSRPFRSNALSGLVEVDTQLGILEAFCTKGGLGPSLSTWYDHGVRNVEYKTLRYPGHCEYMRFLLDECNLTCDQFVEVLQQSCPATKEDLIIMRAEVNWPASVEKIFERIVYSDSRWTAMQKCTAFPAAVVASLMAEDCLSTKDSLSHYYAQIPLKSFNERLGKLGL